MPKVARSRGLKAPAVLGLRAQGVGLRLLPPRLLSALCVAWIGLSSSAQAADSAPPARPFTPERATLYRPSQPPPQSCEQTQTPAAPSFPLAAFEGVSLEDLPPETGLVGRDLTALLKARLAPLDLGQWHSVSVVGHDAEGLLLLVITEQTQARTPTVWGTLVGLPFQPNLSLESALEDLTVFHQHNLSASPMSVQVSLSDRSTLVSFPALGLKRIFPASLGALDSIREYPELTSLTPIMELGRINPKGSLRHTPKGSWLRGLPFLNIEGAFGRTMPAPLTPSRLGYYKTNLGFHASPVKFRRTYNSHGCVTLRDAELLELSSLVLSRTTPTPLQIQAAPLEFDHPLPFETERYARLVNIGTETQPRFTLRGALYHIEFLNEGVPPVEHLKGRYLDGEQKLHANGRLARFQGAPATLRL